MISSCFFLFFLTWLVLAYVLSLTTFRRQLCHVQLSVFFVEEPTLNFDDVCLDDVIDVDPGSISVAIQSTSFVKILFPLYNIYRFSLSAQCNSKLRTDIAGYGGLLQHRQNTENIQLLIAR